jgi:hypothetical protein
MKDIYNAEDIDRAQVAIKAFEVDYGAKYPKAVAKIVDDLDVLLEFYKYPCRALDSSENHQPDRVGVCHSSVAHQGHQGARVTRGRDCHGPPEIPQSTVRGRMSSNRSAYGHSLGAGDTHQVECRGFTGACCRRVNDHRLVASCPTGSGTPS